MYDLKDRIRSALDIECCHLEVPMWVRDTFWNKDMTYSEAFLDFLRRANTQFKDPIRYWREEESIFLAESDLLRLIDFICVCGYLKRYEAERWKMSVRRMCEKKREEVLNGITKEIEDEIRSNLPEEVRKKFNITVPQMDIVEDVVET